MPCEEVADQVDVWSLLSVFEGKVLEDGKSVDAVHVLGDSLLLLSTLDGINVLESVLLAHGMPELDEG